MEAVCQDGARRGHCHDYDVGAECRRRYPDFLRGHEPFRAAACPRREFPACTCDCGYLDALTPPALTGHLPLKVEAFLLTWNLHSRNNSSGNLCYDIGER